MSVIFNVLILVFGIILGYAFRGKIGHEVKSVGTSVETAVVADVTKEVKKL